MKWETRQTVTAYAFLLVPILFFVCIRILPALYAFLLSLFPQHGTGFTLANFQRMAAEPLFWRSLWNTLQYVLITVPCQMGAGLLLALLIGRVRHLRGLYRTIYFLPYITSTVAVSWVWRLLYDANSGFLNELLGWLHLPAQTWLRNPAEALVCVSVVMIWQSAGFSMLIFMAGLESIPKSLYEAARVDGASRFQLFWGITWPLLNPTLVFLAVTGVISGLQTFTQIANLTGGSSNGQAGGPLHSTLSIVLYVYNSGFSDFNLPYASAITVVLFLFILAVSLLQLKVFSKEYEH